MGAGGGIQVGLCIAAFTLSGTLHTIWVVLAVLVGIGLLIFVHELGHFLVAKACGVKCEKFYLGFDVPIKIGPIALPRTLGRFKLGETEYGIGIIPLGGYVKMLGQDDNPAHAQKEAERIRVARTHAAPGATDEGGDADAEATEYELDPRSFPAKSVPQRMAIISAGVIMNLITAVIFAAIAYGIGVTYLPCELGGITGGSPAWANNVPQGSKIVQIGRSGREYDHLRFEWDLMQDIALHGAGGDPQPIDLKLELPDGRREWVSLVPSDRLVQRGLTEFVSLGVRARQSTTLATELPLMPGSAATRAEPPLRAGDRIIAVNGRALEASRANEAGELPADEYEAASAANLAQPLTVTVERLTVAENTSSRETLDVTIPPQPLRTVGLVMQIGAIEVVRQGSPAAESGIREGDLLVGINGQPVGDPFVLPQRFEKWSGQPVRLDIVRAGGQVAKRIEIVVTPEARYRYDRIMVPSSLVTIESIGVAYAVGNTVAAVDRGSPAAKSGMRAGDVLQQVTLRSKAAENPEIAELLGDEPDEETVPFDAQKENWPYVAMLLQELPSPLELRVAFARGEQEYEAIMQPVDSPNWFYVDRGVRFMKFTRIHTASSWSEAWWLGLRETKESLQKVFNFLVKLATGRVSHKALGGPLSILAVAGSEASEGAASLLLFMTFLSANLAILNFLPIPALDGGHIMFLLAEAVTGKPVDERLQGTLTLIGVACLIGLMVLVFYNDIGRFF